MREIEERNALQIRLDKIYSGGGYDVCTSLSNCSRIFHQTFDVCMTR
jgi:hypothetical protein